MRNNIYGTYYDCFRIDILIIEGLYANYIKESDYQIHLDGTFKDTKSFRIERMKEPQNRFRDQVLRKEHNDVIKTVKNAELIIPYKITTHIRK